MKMEGMEWNGEIKYSGLTSETPISGGGMYAKQLAVRMTPSVSLLVKSAQPSENHFGAIAIFLHQHGLFLHQSKPSFNYTSQHNHT